ncbi:hypothetical protein okayama9524_01070 [Yersinia pseudotuberculosis]
MHLIGPIEFKVDHDAKYNADESSWLREFHICDAYANYEKLESDSENFIKQG